MIDPRITSERDKFWKASVSRSEIRSRAELKCACLCFCTLHTNEIPRTDPLVQVDYVRVVDLDIGASKSDICAIRVITKFGARRQNSCLQPRVDVGTAMENVESTGRLGTRPRKLDCPVSTVQVLALLCSQGRASRIELEASSRENREMMAMEFRSTAPLMSVLRE